MLNQIRKRALCDMFLMKHMILMTEGNQQWFDSKVIIESVYFSFLFFFFFFSSRLLQQEGKGGFFFFQERSGARSKIF